MEVDHSSAVFFGLWLFVVVFTQSSVEREMENDLLLSFTMC